jgi:hypothetical protein
MHPHSHSLTLYNTHVGYAQPHVHPHSHSNTLYNTHAGYAQPQTVFKPLWPQIPLSLPNLRLSRPFKNVWTRSEEGPTPCLRLQSLQTPQRGKKQHVSEIFEHALVSVCVCSCASGGMRLCRGVSVAGCRCVYVRVCGWVWVRECVHVCVCLGVGVRACTFVCWCVCAWVQVYECVRLRVFLDVGNLLL